MQNSNAQDFSHKIIRIYYYFCELKRTTWPTLVSPGKLTQKFASKISVWPIPVVANLVYSILLLSDFSTLVNFVPDFPDILVAPTTHPKLVKMAPNIMLPKHKLVKM